MADIEIPSDWADLHWKTQVALAEKLSGKEGLVFKDAYPIIKAEVDRRAPAIATPGTASGEMEEMSIEPPATRAAIEAAKPKMVRMKLVKNYRPAEEFEVLGYDKPAVIVKDAGGRPVELSKAAFVEGEAKPPAQAGTGFIDKLWAGTVGNFTTDEAKRMRANGIATVEID